MYIDECIVIYVFCDVIVRCEIVLQKFGIWAYFTNISAVIVFCRFNSICARTTCVGNSTTQVMLLACRTVVGSRKRGHIAESFMNGATGKVRKIEVYHKRQSYLECCSLKNPLCTSDGWCGCLLVTRWKLLFLEVAWAVLRLISFTLTCVLCMYVVTARYGCASASCFMRSCSVVLFI